MCENCVQAYEISLSCQIAALTFLRCLDVCYSGEGHTVWEKQMRNLSIVLLASAAIAMSAPAFAQVSAANNPEPNSASPATTSMSPPANATAATGDPSLDQVVCKNEPAPTGSRIGGAHVCKTNREWLQDEDALNRARNNEQQTENVMPGGNASHSLGGSGH
jgi:hypothetical protein